MKRSLPFVMLQTSNIASGVGNGIVMIAVPWLVLDLTGSPAAAGLLGALVMLPGIVVSPFIGTMIDRIGRRKVSIYADVLSAVSVLLFVLVDRVGELTYIWVVLLAVLEQCSTPRGIRRARRLSLMLRLHLRSALKPQIVATKVCSPSVGRSGRRSVRR